MRRSKLVQTPFSELYSKYYTLTQHLLDLTSDKPITLSKLREIVATNGFLESPLSLIPPLTMQDEESYHLLIKEASDAKDATYHSILKHPPKPYLTNLELEWMKSLLSDQKLHLFLDEEDLYLLKKALSKHHALITPERFCYVRQNANKKTYTSSQYTHCFKTLLTALQKEKQVNLVTSTGETLKAIPYKIEYAILEDTFSLLAILTTKEKLKQLIRLPLDSITEVQLTEKAPSRKILDSFVQSVKCTKPLVFELNNMRSGFERAFMYLSPYERLTEYNEVNDTCLVQLYYYPFDEAELISTLLSFGPIVKVLSPVSIKEHIKKLLDQQYLLFANFFSR